MPTKPATGSARLKDGILTVKTMRKRGKKMIPLIVTYRVADSRPDPRVAHPAFSLTKGELVRTETELGYSEVFWPSKDGEVYHVFFDEYGVHCDCKDGELREKRGTGPCKHAKSCQAVGLIPK